MTLSQVKEQPKNLPRQRLAEWLDGEYDYERPRRREIREALIVDINESDIVVDLGTKRDGIVPRTDLELLDKTYRASLQVGDRIPVFILRTWGHQDEVVVSINKGLQQHDWLRAEEFLKSGEVFESEVIALNRGGLLASFGRLRGFIPNSHLASIPRRLQGERLKEAKSNLVGQTLSLVVLEVNRRRRRLVLSERMATRHRRQQLLEELNEGDVRTGVVCSLVNFGAFVDLGGVDGLIHISELDWRKVRRPQEVLSEGDEVEVYVLSVDREKERIGLSRKRLLPDPWPLVIENIRVGDVIEGTLTSTVKFGAFVDIGEGVEGLVHVSEMPDGDETRESLEAGSAVQVQVLKIDSRKRRISLSMRIVPWSVADLPGQQRS